jgi:hypothetical protein
MILISLCVMCFRMFKHDNIMNIHDLVLPPGIVSPRDVSDLYIVSELMATDLYRIIYSSQVKRVIFEHCFSLALVLPVVNSFLNIYNSLGVVFGPQPILPLSDFACSQVHAQC